MLSKVEADGTPPIPTSKCVRSRDRAIRAARCWGAEVRGPAVALAFARGGADVLISYLGSEEVDAEETVR